MHSITENSSFEVKFPARSFCFTRLDKGAVKFLNNFYLRRVIDDIVSKFCSSIFNGIQDIGVHTDEQKYRNSLTNPQTLSMYHQ